MNSELKTSSLNTEVNVQTTQPLIALYCGSRSGNKPIYQEKAIALAQGLAKQGFGLVYGGASIGIMGQVADAMSSHHFKILTLPPQHAKI